MPSVQPIIRTALADIAPDSLGICSAHEHVIIDSPHVSKTWPDFDLSDANEAAAELRLFKQAGGSAVVDLMPAGCGRNAAKCAIASQLSGVHVVLSTGVHLAKYYPNDHWILKLDVQQLADLFVADIHQGIPQDDNTPQGTRTDKRAGVIKIAGGRNRLDEFQIRLFQAAATAHVQTGCPVITHTEQGTAALEQAQLLLDNNADPSKIVLSHVDRVTDIEYHREILATGVRVEYDAAFRHKDQAKNPTVELIANLAPDFPEQITVGMDLARRSYKQSLGGKPGLPWLINQLRPSLLKRGIQEQLVQRIYVDNPAAALSFVASTQP